MIAAAASARAQDRLSPAGHLQGQCDRVVARPLGRRRRSAQRRRGAGGIGGTGGLWPGSSNISTISSRCSSRARRRRATQPFLWAKRDERMAADQLGGSGAAGRCARRRRSRRSGLQPGDRVCLVSENRPEWLIADLAIMAAGLRDGADLHHQYDPRSLAHPRQFGRARGHRLQPEAGQKPHSGGADLERLPPCHRHREPLRSGQAPDWVSCHSWPELASERGDADALARRDAAHGASDLACLIYTSGTGGAPRGVRQHHGAILAQLSKAHRHHLDRFRLGRRSLPVVPAGEPCL